MTGTVFSAAGVATLVQKKIPACQSREILLKLLRVGVCGSDIQVFTGRNKYIKYPVVPFHEGLALVQEMSEDVVGFERGDLVTVRPIISCGTCRSCSRGRGNACENFTCLGLQRDGLGDEYFAINAEFVHRLDKTSALDEAILIEPFAVGVHAAKRGEVSSRNVMVVGGGTIGNFTAQAAKLMGAKKVLVCDVSEDKIAMALAAGVDFAVNTSQMSLKAAAFQTFGAEDADVIFDCVGAAALLPQILKTARNTTRIVVVANYGEQVTLDITKIQRNELDLCGSISYTREDFEEAVQMFAGHRVYTEGFITSQYKITEVQEAMENAVKFKGINMKTILEF